MTDDSADRPVPPPAPRTPGCGAVLLVGAVDAGAELVLALRRLGAEVTVVDDRSDGPLCRVADRSVAADPADADALAATLRSVRPSVVVAAAGAAAGAALTAAGLVGSVDLVPGLRASELAADFEARRRLAADELGVPTVPFWFAGSVAELRSVAEHAGLPMVVTPVAAPVGAGRSVMVRPGDIEPAWRYAVSAATAGSPERVLAETVVEFDCAVTLLTVCTGDPTEPTVDFCAPIGHRQVAGPAGQLLLESWQPQPVSAAALDAARSIAARVVRAFGGRGLFGVELLIRGDEVYFVDVDVAGSESALLTLRTQRLSSGELQARAILGLPVDTILVSPGAARLTYVGDRVPQAASAGAEQLAGALSVAESDVLAFGAGARGPRRRLGAAIATATDVATARDRAARVAAQLGEPWR